MYISPIIPQSDIKTGQLSFRSRENQFEKDMELLIQNSVVARKELLRENFNSETLRTLLTPAFSPQHPNCLMAVSATTPYKPVEVIYRTQQDDDFLSMDIFSKDKEETLLGKTQCRIRSEADGKKKFISAGMISYEETCKKASIKGIGTLETILEMLYTIKNGMENITRISTARAVLYHLKMGFMPVPELERIRSAYDIEKIMKKITDDSKWDISRENFTPIIVSEEIPKNKEYYLDKNTTRCVAYLRQIKQNYERRLGESVRPFIRGWVVEMSLKERNYNILKRMVKKVY